MEFVKAVQRKLKTGEKCVSSIEGGLIQDWIKTSRILALVEKSGEFALFIFISTKFQNEEDLSLDIVLPIESDFRLEIDTNSSCALDIGVFVAISWSTIKLLIELPIGAFTNTFLSQVNNAAKTQELKDKSSHFEWALQYLDMANYTGSDTNLFSAHAERVLSNIENQGSQPPSLIFEDNFNNYVSLKPSTASSSSNPSSRSTTLESLNSDKISPDINIPRHSIALGMQAMPARENVIRMQMHMKEDEYTDISTFRIFVGTWNVNGQIPAISLRPWLAKDPDPPDLYAVGFQELDLSKEAFLFNDSPREGEWVHAVERSLHSDAKYERVHVVRLVGMMLIIFVQVKHRDCINNIAYETVGTGILGKMGNKGGVAVRFDLHNTSFCFVNSHLAAHVEEYERRNQDYNDICTRLVFQQSHPQKNIKDHDAIFWLGDLNYRLSDMDKDTAKLLLEAHQFEKLLEHDQLKRQLIAKNVFHGYIEGEINFIPTYKYDPGTDNWDSSEKCRIPAWCDRILWRGIAEIMQLEYRNHMTLRISDHKPVSAIFNVGVKVMDIIKYRKIYEDVMKRLDKLENEFLPQATVDTPELHFKDVMFIEPQTKILTIANTGQVPVQFEFIKKLDDTRYCKEWLSIKPYINFIMPGEKCDVEFEVYVDKQTAHKLNSGKDSIYDILVLHLDGGKDIFITVNGNYIPSCFGSSLEALVQMHSPISEVPVAQLIDLEQLPSPDSFDSLAKNEIIQRPFDVPKEVWLLVDHLYSCGLRQEDLFQQPGRNLEILQIRDFLDTGAYGKLPGSNHSIAEALLIVLEALPESVIPTEFYNKCLDCCHNFLLCKQVLSQIPVVHRTVFKYLMAFLRELLLYSQDNRLDSKVISSLFGSLILRPPPTTKKNYPVENRRSAPQQLIERKKATFVHHFLIQDYDE